MEEEEEEEAACFFDDWLAPDPKLDCEKLHQCKFQHHEEQNYCNVILTEITAQ